MTTVSLTAVPDLPDIRPGDDVAQLLIDTLQRSSLTLQDGDLLALAHKIISKAEGRLVKLSAVVPGERACEVAVQVNKDPRLVELILQESEEISRMKPGVLVVRHRLGFTSANAGIDRSNVQQENGEETVLLLPIDPDASAARLRAAIREQLGADVGVLIVDSHGRPFRLGTVGVAIGVAGMPSLWDRRGESDLYGYRLEHTEVGTADEIAAAASMLMGQAAEATPVILIRGLSLPPVQGKASDLIRPKSLDMYR
ncbi:MAG: coenzyme F420-0:L-glutamate ligase [Candidatus Promineifilaceae bacterium]